MSTVSASEFEVGSIDNFVIEKVPHKSIGKRLLGLTCALLSAIFQALSGVVLVACLPKDSQSGHSALVQFVINMLILYPIIGVKRTNVLGPTRQSFILLLVRGFSGATAYILLLLSYKFIPLGDALTIFNGYIVFTGVLACVLLSEPCGIFEAIATVFTLAGIVFIAQPPFIFGINESTPNSPNSTDRMIGVLISMVGSIGASLAMVSLRKIGKAIHFTVSVFYFSWIGFVVCSIYILIAKLFVVPCLTSITYIALAAILVFTSQVFMTLGFQNEKAGPVALVRSSQAIFGFIFEYFALGNAPNMFAAIGAVLMMSSSSALMIRTIKNRS